MLLRPARREDVDPVLDLFCRYEERYRGFADSDASDITDDWDLPGFDLAASTRTLEDDGTVVGYAVADGTGWCDTVTEPDRAGERLVVPLLEWLETLPGTLEHFVPDSDTDLQAVLRERGWLPARVFWRMAIDLGPDLPEPVWPEGVTVRTYDRPSDDAAVHALVTSGLGESGETPKTLERWRASMLDNDKFDPSLYLVAERDGRLAGASLSQDTGPYGYVRQLAVAPEERGRGLGLALLYECFRRHRDRGLPWTGLGVNAANPTGAVRLYERAGMRVAERFTRWERPAGEDGS